jgi:hypothetical protein
MKKVNNFLNFLKEEVSEKIHLYFIHPKLTYGSRTEEQSVELINIYFDNPILYNIQGQRSNFFDNVEEINNIVVLPYPNGMVSPKTYKRIQFAFDRLINIYYIHPQKFKIIKVEEIEFFTNKLMTQNDWEEKTNSSDDYFKDAEIV